jgi:hypothetical protein
MQGPRPHDLCKAGNRAVAEYALGDIAKPVGVSSYVTRLVESPGPGNAGWRKIVASGRPRG